MNKGADRGESSSCPRSIDYEYYKACARQLRRKEIAGMLSLAVGLFVKILRANTARHSAIDKNVQEAV
jgi:hypothetical protein